jgi:hypothetical protein
MRQEKLNERFEFEKKKMNDGNNFELIFPPTGEEEREAILIKLLKKAQEIWDEFTTGKAKKKIEAAPTKLQPQF